MTAAAAAASRDDDGDGDDCALNSAHLFFRQDGGESYFGLGGWSHVLAGPLRAAGAGLPPPPPAAAHSVSRSAGCGAVPPAADHSHRRPSPLAVPHFVSTGGALASPSRSLFPGAAIVRSPLLLMRQCRWPARRRSVSVLWRGRPTAPPPCARCSPGGAVIVYVRRCGEVAEAVLMSSSRLDGQRWHCGASGPSTTPPPPRLSFPWLFPSALVVPLAARSRLVVNVSEEEWQM